MIKGSRPGSGSIPLTRSGSRRPKNTWIRIRNTDCENGLVVISLPCQCEEEQSGWHSGQLAAADLHIERFYMEIFYSWMYGKWSPYAAIGPLIPVQYYHFADPDPVFSNKFGYRFRGSELFRFLQKKNPSMFGKSIIFTIFDLLIRKFHSHSHKKKKRTTAFLTGKEPRDQNLEAEVESQDSFKEWFFKNDKNVNRFLLVNR